MNSPSSRPRLTRRGFLLGGAGAATVVAVGRSLPSQPATGAAFDLTAANPLDATIHLAATDGWVAMPGPVQPNLKAFWPDPLAASHGTGLNLYVFGFRDVTGLTADQVTLQRGKAQISAPQLVFDEGTEVRVTLSNLGLSQRPDLVDGHTIHWHGFVNAIPLFDGVPELSMSVPIGRDFTYFYRPKDAGTYMYHCHYEDVEHVQMGMTGMLFVRPKQNHQDVALPDGTVLAAGTTKYAYNDGDGSTRYDREFGYMLTEIWAEGHYRDAHIQTSDWTDFNPSFWLMNGRSYPQTLVGPGSRDPGTGDLVAPAGHPEMQYQPIPSLITCNAGDRVLLRLSSLGYQSHPMTVDGIDLRVVARDAVQLSHPYTTTQVQVAPGESHDVIFTAPAKTGSGAYDTYLFYDRNYAYASNAGNAGLGGIATEIRVYPSGYLAPQAQANDLSAKA